MLRLSLAKDVGPITFARLMEAFGDPRAVFESTVGRLTDVEGVGEKTAANILAVSERQVDAELELVAKQGARLVALGDEDYPADLARIFDPPVVLYVRGELKRVEPAVAIVGSRSASFYGRKQSRRIASGLAGYGFAVVSGGARGIDASAHEGALEAGGRTIAVLGTGLACTYPPENADLMVRIASSGAVVSEFPMLFPAAAGNFPRRNRIISGLSLGVVVVEAAEKSGALITAKHAMEQNREVFAVPGPVDSPNSRGCHRLLRDGACLVEGPADVVEAFGPLAEKAPTKDIGEIIRPQALMLNEREKAVYAALDSTARSVDDLADETGLSVSELNGTLTVLEMRRLVKRLPGPAFVRT
jgi:DNA processing protein